MRFDAVQESAAEMRRDVEARVEQIVVGTVAAVSPGPPKIRLGQNLSPCSWQSRDVRRRSSTSNSFLKLTIIDGEPASVPNSIALQPERAMSAHSSASMNLGFK